MKKIILVIFFLSFKILSHAQSYNSNQSVEVFAEGRWYYNSETKSKVKYGYISPLNTYGLTLKTSKGNTGYFMNCSINFSSDKQYMELTGCMNPETGGGVGRVGFYKDRIIFSGDDGKLTYYLED